MILLPWREFFAKGNFEREMELCLLAEQMLATFCLNYEFKGEIPQLYVTNAIGINPQAKSNGKILISHDTINWLDNAFADFPKKLTDIAGKNSAAKIMMMWFIAHEFIHIARAHHSFLNKPEHWEPALEYDADLFAIAAVFRHVHHLCQSSNSQIIPIDTKKFLITCIFFYLRDLIEKIEVEHNQAHQPFHIRLWLIIEKLAWVDNYSMKTLIPTKEFTEELGIFLHTISSAEKTYASHRKTNYSKLNEYFSNIPETILYQLSPIREKWENLSPLVMEKQLIKERVVMPTQQ